MNQEYERAGRPERAIVMLDGASPHRALYTQQQFRNAGIPLLKWPPYSPDLNPIENIWKRTKEHFHRLNARPTQRQDVVRTVMGIWSSIRGEVLQQLVDTMPQRLRCVIRANGGPTHW